MMTTFDWIKAKCRNGLIFLTVYGMSVFLFYCATIPPDRSRDGLLGEGISLFENLIQGAVIGIMLFNPAATFLAGRAVTAIVIFFIFDRLYEKGRDIEMYSKAAHTAMIAVPVCCIFLPFIYLALS